VIASYWGWSGFIQTLRDTRFYDAVQQVTQTGLSASGLCFLVLTVHVLIGLVLTYAGTRSARWD
jgi:ABC transport system ATP-binding/permease protein